MRSNYSTFKPVSIKNIFIQEIKMQEFIKHHNYHIVYFELGSIIYVEYPTHANSFNTISIFYHLHVSLRVTINSLFAWGIYVPETTVQKKYTYEN